jgi:ABC-2 type transport system permease protein
MHLRPTLAVARKDALDVLLNKSTLIMLLTPVFIAILFAVLSGLLGSKPPKLLIYNPDHSHVSQVVSSAIPRSQVVLAGSPGEVKSEFAQGKNTSYAMGLVIPSGFDASLSQEKHPQLTLYFNGRELNEVQCQLVVRTLNDYANSVSHPQPPVNIAITSINTSTTNVTPNLSTFYVAMALLTSISVSISLVSTLLVEEKETKTLHMLLVSPASLSDVVLGKLLVGLGYQLILAGVVMALLQGFVGNLPLVFLFVLLITCFGLALSLLAGAVFRTTSGVGGFLGVVSLLFVIPVVFVGPLGALLGNNLLLRGLHFLPTYYMADGLLNALQNQGTPGGMLLDLGVTLGCMLVCLGISVWLLYRQAVVTASI